MKSRLLWGSLVFALSVLNVALLEAQQVQRLPLAPRPPSGEPVAPFFEGWYANPDGTYTFSFGYFNLNMEETLDIPLGPDNFIEPAGFDGNQPTHFPVDPRRDRGIFTVTVPASYADREQRVVWTIRSNGVTYSVPARVGVEALQLDYGPRAMGSVPPLVRLEAGGVEGQHATGVSLTEPRVATAGGPLTLTVWASEVSERSADDIANRDGVAVRLLWFKHQGPPGAVVFEEREVVLEEGTGEATTTATFGEPGDYVLRVRVDNWAANDSSGGDQCCWTNGYVPVTVLPEAAGAITEPQAARLSKEFIDPAGSFTQVVTSTSQGVKTIYVSGQVGRGDDFAAHVDSAFAGVVRRLESAGATPADVVKIRIYVKDFEPETYGVVAAARRRTFVEGRWPASTMVGVQSLFAEQLQVEIEAIAVVEDPAAGGAVLEREFVGPSSGFSRVVAVSSGGVKTIWVSGQVGQSDDLAAQSASVFEALARNLESVGASLADVVKTNTYIADYEPEDRRVFGEVRTAALGGENLPSSTLIGVQALAADRFKVEVDAVAVVVEDGAEGGRVERAFIDPAGGFTQVVTTESGATKTIYVSGQVGRRADDLETQAGQAYENLRSRLEAAGASVADLVKVNFYFANYLPGDARVLGPARSMHGFPNDDFPAATLIGIPSLYADRALIEIEGIAIVER